LDSDLGLICSFLALNGSEEGLVWRPIGSK
jgi:hypothetical protein